MTAAKRRDRQIGASEISISTHGRETRWTGIRSQFASCIVGRLGPARIQRYIDERSISYC